MSSGRDQESAEMMKHEDKFFSSVLSKENSRVNSSSRVYYYGGASVPFVWESQPGTPKHTLFSESSHPLPLTPPPSYHSKNMSTQQRTLKSKQNYVSATLFRLGQKKSRHVSPSFSCSSTSSSSSSSFSLSPSSKNLTGKKKYYISSSRSPVPVVKDDDDAAEDEEIDSPTSTLCFGSKQTDLKESRRGFGSSVVNAKKALYSFFKGHS